MSISHDILVLNSTVEGEQRKHFKAAVLQHVMFMRAGTVLFKLFICHWCFGHLKMPRPFHSPWESVFIDTGVR